MSNKIFLIIFSIIAIVIGTALFWNKKAPNLYVPSENVGTSTPISVDNFPIELSGTGDYSIEQVPLASHPSLDRPIAFPDTFNVEAKKKIGQDIVAVVTELRGDQSNINNWLRLATYREIINDYDGAVEILEFIAPYREGPVIFGNLGGLYHLYIREYSKSEVNYKKAIALGPQQIIYYRGLHELYKYSYKQNTTLAVDTLLDGLKANPDNTDLLVLLGLYYREKGNISQARFYYQSALEQAKKNNDTNLVSAISRDLERLE